MEQVLTEGGVLGFSLLLCEYTIRTNEAVSKFGQLLLVMLVEKVTA